MSANNDAIAQAIHENFTSPNVSDSNWEAANVVDGLDKIGRAIYSATHTSSNPDRSLVDALYYIGGSLKDVAEAIQGISGPQEGTSG